MAVEVEPCFPAGSMKVEEFVDEVVHFTMAAGYGRHLGGASELGSVAGSSQSGKRCDQPIYDNCLAIVTRILLNPSSAIAMSGCSVFLDALASLDVTLVCMYVCMYVCLSVSYLKIC